MSASEGTRTASGDNSLGTSALNAATSIGQATTDVVDAAGKITSSAAKTSSALVTNLGNVASSGTQIVSSTIGAIAETTKRMENSTKEMATRRALIEQQKTSAQQGKTAAEIGKIEADTKLKLQQIDNEHQISQKKEEDKLANEIAKLNSSQIQQLLTQQDNADKKSKSFYYGFINSNPNPMDIGSVKALLYKTLCYSYIPKYFVTETGTIIDIVLPERKMTDDSKRDAIIQAKDKSNRDILIDFVTQKNTSFYGPTFLTVPVIQYSDDNPSVNNGKMYYNKIWFVCNTNGGKKRLTKRRINKRRTYKRRTYKKINKRRTYKNNKR